jgi:hypothetical protein
VRRQKFELRTIGPLETGFEEIPQVVNAMTFTSAWNTEQT